MAAHVLANLVLAGLLAGPANALALAHEAHQPAATHAGPAEAGQPAAEGEHGAAAAHGPGIWSTIAKLVNFAVLAGTLVYFLRAPIAAYMRDRAETIRHDLVTAKQMKAEARAQLDEIDARMRALPAELEALKTRGARDIAAEEARIVQHAEAERARLVEQTRRDLDLQLRAAKRELVAHAAELAVSLASDRLKSALTGDDHARLADRFIRDMSHSREAS